MRKMRAPVVPSREALSSHLNPKGEVRMVDVGTDSPQIVRQRVRSVNPICRPICGPICGRFNVRRAAHR